jgi:hypothetical protein
MGINQTRRLWCQAGLGLPRKRLRRRIAASRPRPLPPRAANHVWAYDFVFDVAGSIRSGRVIDDRLELPDPGHQYGPSPIEHGEKR